MLGALGVLVTVQLMASPAWVVKVWFKLVGITVLLPLVALVQARAAE